jgi:predicted ATPase/DNA-binding CsgD family transcriptional regulator
MLQELTPRERSVLAAVGRRLTNGEIAEEFHVSVRTVESHIASLRRKLGVSSRAALVEHALEQTLSYVAVPDNTFVGRERDLEGLERLVAEHRLVTLTGAAGCGKTRLALEFARRRPGNVVVVDLAAAAAPSDVVTAIAGALSVAPGTPDLLAACGMALSAGAALLVLDNCDRVTDAAALAVGRLLDFAPALHVLTTSRTPLLRPGEAVHSVLPLGTDRDAVALLLDRAQAAAPDAPPSDRDVALRICRRLDGVPLAIELAAARLRHLAPDELDRLLASGFAALGGAASERHRTLEAAFTWSWELLSDRERDVLSRLAALPGPFDLALAEVAAGPGADAVTLELLDKSLVMRVDTGTPAPFRLLTIVRELVLARAPAELRADVRRAHVRHVVELAGRAAARARTDDSRPAAAAAARLAPAAVDAIDWALHDGDELVAPLVGSMAVLVEQYGGTAELLAALARAARHPVVRAEADATTVCALGYALCYHDMELVDDLARHVQALRGDERSDLAAHLLAGTAAAYLGRVEEALVELAAGERLARSLGDDWSLGSLLQARGMALKEVAGGTPEHLGEAMAAFEAALQAYAAAGDAMHVNNVRYMMASTACEAGTDLERAITWADQCATYADAVDNRHELAHAILTRARLTGSRSEMPQAAEAFTALGDLRCLTRCHLHLADHAASHDSDPVPHLQRAYEVATRAHDDSRRAVSLERLVREHWARRRPEEAALALGMLAAVVGQEQALVVCPELASELATWMPTVARGRASAAAGR